MGHSFHVSKVVLGVSEAETAIHESQDKVHCHKDCMEFQRQKVGRVDQVDSTHYHGQICRLISVQLLNDDLPAFAEEIEEGKKNSVANCHN